MGNYYVLHEDRKFGELAISEMSNRLSLLHDNQLNNQLDNKYGRTYVSEEMTPEEMVDIFLTGLTVCSYWMDSEELKKRILKFAKHGLY